MLDTTNPPEKLTRLRDTAQGGPSQQGCTAPEGTRPVQTKPRKAAHLKNTAQGQPSRQGCSPWPGWSEPRDSSQSLPGTSAGRHSTDHAWGRDPQANTGEDRDKRARPSGEAQNEPAS